MTAREHVISHVLRSNAGDYGAIGEVSGDGRRGRDAEVLNADGARATLRLGGGGVATCISHARTIKHHRQGGCRACPWRLSRSGFFEAFFDALASLSQTAHLVQMLDFTVVRAHVSAAGAKGGQDSEALGRSEGNLLSLFALRETKRSGRSRS
jgi:hypothetical protein